MAELEDRNEKLEAKRRELQEEIQVRYLVFVGL